MRDSEWGREAVFHTSLGWAGAAVSGRGVAAVILPKKEKGKAERDLKAAKGARPAEKTSAAAGRVLEKAAARLRRYFSGERVSFDLPLDIRYYTPFQQAVWKAAAAIPYGETRSYGWIAQRIGKPKAARAVGRALGANPLPVIIP